MLFRSRQPKTWSKDRKTDRITLDREQVVQVDPTHLPSDAVFKGYEDVVVQDVLFRTDNVLFHKEKFQIPPDLVVKFQCLDIVDVILWLVLRPRVVYLRGIKG